MARIFPTPLPEAVLKDPRRAAERKMCVELERKLAQEAQVFYSVAWLARNRQGDAKDGEADFVVVDPTHGLLVIEVKGGHIARDGATGTWSSNHTPIHDPVAQARNNRYALMHKIRSLPGWGDRWVHIGHAVAFPDCSVPTHSLTPDLPREIAIFNEDLLWLDQKVGGIFDYWHAELGGQAAIDAGAQKILQDALAPTFDLKQPLGMLLNEEDQQILRLTEQEFRVLDALKRNRRMAISGGAGTGKTLLALEKAKRLAAEGYATLLTCFNVPLAECLRQSAGPCDNLTIMNFHHWCDVVRQNAGVELPAAESLPRKQTFFDDLLPEALVEALGRLPQKRFDAIVVDEGQDFRRDWWVALQLGLRDPNDGILYIFYDNNQKIFRRDGGIPERLASFELTENLRNTKSIHRIARGFYSGGDLDSVGPEGRPVEFVEARSAHGVRKAVSSVLHRLINTERIAPEDIAILSGRVWEKSAFADLDQVGNFEIARDARGEPGKVMFETVHRFKGLERQVVILTEMDSYVDRESSDVLYVGLTRARLHLVVIGVQNTIQAIRGDVKGVDSGRAGQS